MQREELFGSVKSTIVDVLDLDDDVDLGEATTADDVEGWDSLQHVRILTTLEKRFGFRFSDQEVQGLKNVGDLVSVVSQRVAAKG
jgi:acyl carrier protein